MIFSKGHKESTRRQLCCISVGSQTCLCAPFPFYATNDEHEKIHSFTIGLLKSSNAHPCTEKALTLTGAPGHDVLSPSSLAAPPFPPGLNLPSAAVQCYFDADVRLLAPLVQAVAVALPWFSQGLHSHCRDKAQSEEGRGLKSHGSHFNHSRIELWGAQ